MPHPTYSALTTCWHGHLLSTSLQGGISKLPVVQNISPVVRWLCAYCCTFFLLPTAGSWTPLINKLLSCFDTKSFLKWTLIKPLQEETSNECWGCRSASNQFFPSPLDFCFHASSTRAHEVSLTKHFSVTGQQSCHKDNFCSQIKRVCSHHCSLYCRSQMLQATPLTWLLFVHCHLMNL